MPAKLPTGSSEDGAANISLMFSPNSVRLFPT